MLKQWYFTAEDWNGNAVHLGPDGREIEEDDARAFPWTGEHDAALDEAQRRADLWERGTQADAATVVAHVARRNPWRTET